MNSDYNYIFYDFEVKILIRTSTFGGVTLKVLSNSKHTLLCLCGHNVLESINLIPLETLQKFAQWLEAQSLQGTAHSVSLLASIYIECCFESASHNFYFLVRCKIKL